MASNTAGKETNNKCLLIVLTIMTSAFVGTLVSWIMIQLRLEQYVTINSLLSTDPVFQEELVIQEPSKFSLDAIESWQSWMEANGLFQKASKKNVDQSLDLESSPVKKILYWNDQNDEPSLKEAGCPISQCQLINRFDVDDLKPAEFDAIVFRYKNLNLKDLPKERLPFQTYVLYERDSPLSHSDKNVDERIPSNFFNLTMTYRWDSDVVVPIGGWIEPASTQMINADQQFDEKQSKIKIAWMVDDAEDCAYADDGKIELIYRLRSYNIQVDIIRNSDCSLLDLVEDCGRKAEDEKPSEPIKHDDGNRLKCRQKVAKEYAFYFAIENELCLDYITEKFYGMLDQPIIPLVMDAHENYAKAAPPHSYINAIDFPSVHDLANYLIRLNENHHLYNEYFLWKKFFKVRKNDEEELATNHLCNLCAALHDQNQLKNVVNNKHSYKDVDDWWVRKAICRRLEDFTMVEEVVVFQ